MGGCHLLLVEDNEDLRHAMAELLSEHGFVVSEAANGYEGVQMARERSPALILLDLMMPVMDGWEFLRIRATDPILSAIPVVVLSAQRAPDLPEGVDVLSVLTKPPDMERLLMLIDQTCRDRIAGGHVR